MLLCLSIVVIYSAGGESTALLTRQSMRIGFAIFLMLIFCRISPRTLMRWSPYIYGLGLILLFIVLAFGFIGKGAQRWIDLGVVRFSTRRDNETGRADDGGMGNDPFNVAPQNTLFDSFRFVS